MFFVKMQLQIENYTSTFSLFQLFNQDCSLSTDLNQLLKLLIIQNKKNNRDENS